MPSAETVLVASRRQLRGLAESLIAGPQYRAAGTIRLAVRHDGFVGVALPLAVHGTEFHWQDGSARLAGTPRALAEAAGVDYGPPDGAYEIVDALAADTEIDLDPGAVEVICRCLYAGGFALKQVLPESHPVLWPEHFDVAVTADEVNYGVSAGDDFHAGPYAYVGPRAPRTGPFWNAPFGAVLTLDATHDVDRLAESVAGFLQRGREVLGAV